MSAPVAVVTGAARGIGRAVATRLAADGYALALLDRDAERVTTTAADLGGRALACDVTDEDAVRTAFGALDRVDVLVNNAGAWRLQRLREVTPADYRTVMDTNVLGTLLCTQRAAAAMAAGGGGAVVNIASLSAVSASTGIGVYAASKAAVMTLTRQSALEYAAEGVRVNAVAPGVIPTEGTPHYGDAANIARQTSVLPLGRPGTPDEIADAVAFLASDAARYVTGQTLFVDGGAEAGLGHFMGNAMRNAGS